MSDTKQTKTTRQSLSASADRSLSAVRGVALLTAG